MTKRIGVALVVCFSWSSLWGMYSLAKVISYLNAVIKYVQIKRYQSMLNDAIVLGNCAYVKKLLACGIDVNERYDEEGTPLHRAAALGEDDIIKMLFIAGARIDIKDEDGKTALEVAHERNNSKSVELLKSYAAHPIRTLKELCINFIRRRREMYQDKLNRLPQELQEEL